MRTKGNMGLVKRAFYVQEAIFDYVVNFRKYPTELTDRMLYIVHKINEKIMMHQRYEYAKISGRELQLALGNTYTEPLRKLRNFIIESDGSAAKGFECNGYRIMMPFRESKCEWYPSHGHINPKYLERKYEESKKCPSSLKNLYRNLKKVKIDESSVNSYINSHLTQSDLPITIEIHWGKRLIFHHERKLNLLTTEPILNTSQDHNTSPPPLTSNSPYNSNTSCTLNPSTTTITHPPLLLPYNTQNGRETLKLKELHEAENIAIGPETGLFYDSLSQLNSDRYWIDTITSSGYYLIQDDQGRVHTNITNCPRRLRPFLRVRGIETLCILDVANSPMDRRSLDESGVARESSRKGGSEFNGLVADLPRRERIASKVGGG